MRGDGRRPGGLFRKGQILDASRQIILCKILALLLFIFCGFQVSKIDSDIKFQNLAALRSIKSRR